MPTRPRCWICAGEFAEPFPTAGDMTHITCTTCGEYVITGSLLASPFPLPDSERYRFSFWSKRRQLEGRSPVSLTVNSVAAILEELPNPSNHEKADILLVSLTLLYPEPGKYFKLDNWRNRSLACARNDSEFEYFVRRLTDFGPTGHLDMPTRQRKGHPLRPPSVQPHIMGQRGRSRRATLLSNRGNNLSRFLSRPPPQPHVRINHVVDGFALLCHVASLTGGGFRGEADIGCVHLYTRRGTVSDLRG